MGIFLIETSKWMKKKLKNDPPGHFFYFGILIAILTIYVNPQLTQARSIYKTKNFLDINKLELKAWICDDDELPRVERSIIHQMQSQKWKSPKLNYLLSHVYIRQFAADPSRISLNISLLLVLS
jgi:hypothetical protein